MIGFRVLHGGVAPAKRRGERLGLINHAGRAEHVHRERLFVCVEVVAIALSVPVREVVVVDLAGARPAGHVGRPINSGATCVDCCVFSGFFGDIPAVGCATRTGGADVGMEQGVDVFVDDFVHCSSGRVVPRATGAGGKI